MTAESAISIGICTHNRARQLADTLDSLLPQAEAHGRCEVIVVANACTDDSVATARSAANDYPGAACRIVTLPEPSLSAARNTVVHQAAGDVTLFLDDDASPLPGWIDAYSHAFADNRVGGAGGFISLEYAVGPPWWISPAMAQMLTEVDWGEAERPLNHPKEWIAGANMGFRTQLLRRHHFSEKLGRRGASLMSGEETHLCWRLIREGWKIMYVPSAAVVHRVPKNRLTASFMLARAYAGGRSTSIIEHDVLGPTQTLKRLPGILRSCAVSTARMALSDDQTMRPQLAVESARSRGRLTGAVRSLLPV